MGVKITILIICLMASAFFSMSETALMSLSKIKIRYMIDEGKKGYKLVDKLLNKPSKLIGGILIGNNIANIGASALATSIAIDAIGEGSVALVTAIMTVLVLIFGEITPKSLAKQNSEKISLLVSRPINIIVKVLTPLVFIFTKISDFLIKILGGEIVSDEPFITEEELKTMVGVSEEEGVLENSEKEFIFNVFKFADARAKDVMVQRMDLIALDSKASYEDVIKLIKTEQLSRIPIYEDTIDNVIGILNIKDILIKRELLNEESEFNIKDYMREANYTYEYKNIMDLFNEMKLARNHMTIVLDEYGGTVGLITIEDLIEEVLGEIKDEYDKLEDDEVIIISDKEYLVDARINIKDLSDKIGVEIQSEDFDSIGGLIFGEIGSLPKQHDEIIYNNMRLVVESVKKNRINKVRVFLE